MINFTFKVQNISFDQILSVWQSKLWPDRKSEIKTHSSMTLLDGTDMGVYNYTASYFGILHNNTLIAVNSGHKVNETEYRSRGLWVDPVYRKKGLATALLKETQKQAQIENCTIIWSLPRKSALPVYRKAGFLQFGDFFSTETADLNCYAVMDL